MLHNEPVRPARILEATAHKRGAVFPGTIVWKYFFDLPTLLIWLPLESVVCSGRNTLILSTL
jgi:hypothetical protein